MSQQQFSIYNNINQTNPPQINPSINYLEQKYANINLNLGNKKYLTTYAKDNRSICISQIQTSDEILNLIYIQQIEKILKNCGNT
jgi:hypothetical protein